MEGGDGGRYDYGPSGAEGGATSGQKSRLHGHPRYVKGQGRRGKYDKSSALSDTSEAPSIASHVRQVRVPSQASDVDQFLDDLFMPVLDGNVDDGLSDARSLAASMRGGGEAKDDLMEIETFSRRNSAKRRSVLRQGLEGFEEESDTNLLSQVASLVSAIRGGKDSPAEERKKSKSDFTPATSSAMGFQPIPGVVSPTGMISPPPMLMPTPVHSMMGANSSNPQSLLMQMPNQSGADQAHPAMAFTYVPVPVYNMGGASLPGLQGVMPGMTPAGAMSPGKSSSERTPSPEKGHKHDGDKQSKDANSSDQEQMTQQMMYQQAFLQNAVAQNMQIQQQLMMQNQALTQLLQQSNTTSPDMSHPQHFGFASTPMSSMMATSMNQTGKHEFTSSSSASPEQMKRHDHSERQQKAEQFFGEAQRRASYDHLLDGSTSQAGQTAEERQLDMKQRSKSTPNTPKVSTANPPQAPLMQGKNNLSNYGKQYILYVFL